METAGVIAKSFMQSPNISKFVETARTVTRIPSISCASIRNVRPFESAPLLASGALSASSSASAVGSSSMAVWAAARAARAAEAPRRVSSSSGLISSPQLLEIKCTFAQKDTDRNGGEKFSFVKYYSLLGFPSNSNTFTWQTLSESAPQELPSNESFSVESESGEQNAVIRNLKSDKGDEKQYLEIFNHNGKEQTVDLSAESVPHGKVYEAESLFATLEWSHSESALLYVAEAKQPKRVSFFEGYPPSNETASGHHLRAESPGQIAAISSPDDTNSKAVTASKKPKAGGQYRFAEDWGEAMRGKQHAVLALYNVDTRQTRLLVDVCGDPAPGDNGEDNGNGASSAPAAVLTALPGVAGPASVGQAVWAPDDSGVVFLAWPERPYRLGLTYCQNRASALYFLELSSARVFRLSRADAACARSPRFSPDGRTLVWLENLQLNGPHVQCSRLMKCSWPSKQAELELALADLETADAATAAAAATSSSPSWLVPEIVIDIVQQADDPRGFPGIFVNADTLPRRCWCEDSRHLLFDSLWGTKRELIAVDLIDKIGARMTLGPDSDESRARRTTPASGDEFASHRVLDVNGAFVLAACSSPNCPDTLRVGLLPQRPPAGDADARVPGTVALALVGGAQVDWHSVNLASVSLAKEFGWQILRHQPPAEDPIQIPFESLLLCPRAEDAAATASASGQHAAAASNAKLSLVCCIHGGPHSAFGSDFQMFSAAFALHKYAVVAPNYRGSIGFGQRSVDSLMGRIGTQDVADCLQAIDEAVKKLREEHNAEVDRVFLFGGSHGGFLVTHLMAARPHEFAAVASRNPVIELSAMANCLSDIPDWCFTESNVGRFAFGHPTSASQMERLYAMSPLSAIDRTIAAAENEKAAAAATSGDLAAVSKQKQPQSSASGSSSSAPNAVPPLLLMLGADDYRVQPQQGLALYHLLRGRGQRVALNVYPNSNHSLSRVPVEGDCLVNVLAFYEHYA